jgi:uncharacterized protein
MPDDGAKPVNVAVLADADRRVELEVPLARMKRIAEHLAGNDGAVSGSVAFSRVDGRIVAEVAARATLALQCQRCLQPVLMPIEGRSSVVLLEDEMAAAAVPPEFETALAPEGRLPLADLLEEELLLALPAAPHHAGNCPGAKRSVTPEVLEQTTQRPFAALGEMLGRSKH